MKTKKKKLILNKIYLSQLDNDKMSQAKSGYIPTYPCNTTATTHTVTVSVSDS
jgi:hypothetical protein